MEVSKKDFESLVDLFDKKYNNNVLTANISTLFPPKRITENIFRNLVKTLRFSTENGGFGLEYDVNTVLRVSSTDEDIKDSLLMYGLENIKKLWLFDLIPNEMKIVQDETGDGYGLVDYSVEICESIRKETDPKLVEKLSDNDVFKRFSYENQIEFLTPDAKHLILFIEKQQSMGKTFRSSMTLLKNKEYEIKLVRDFIRFPKDKIEDEIENYLQNLSFVLGLIQDSSLVVGKKEIGSVYTQYSLLAGKSMPLGFKDYIGVEPVYMSRKNGRVSKEIISVLENYGVRYNVVGENCLLIVIENNDDSELNGGLYLYSQNLQVRRLNGLEPDFGRSIFDCTYVADKNMLVINDCLFHNGKDMRTTHFVYPKGSRDNLSRIDVVLKFIKSLGMNKIADIEYDTRIIRNSVKFGSGPDIFDKSSELINTVNEFPVKVDGLVYVPIRDHVPTKGGLWESMLMWKEPSNLTIPFLVHFEKNPDTEEDVRYPFTQHRPDGFMEVKQYKILNLSVSGQRESFNKMTRKYYKMTTAVPFAPTFPLINGIDVDSIHKAKIVVNDKDQAEIEPGVEIIDGMIVEFAYSPELEGKSDMLWIPVRIRWDMMTIDYNESGYYGIEQRFANDFWRIVHFPISVKMIRDKYIEDEPIETTTSVYYSELDVRVRNLERMPYMNFHNWCIKNYLFNIASPAVRNKNSGQKGSLIDFASGRGADLFRYKTSRFKTVLGIEIVKESVDHAVDRYKKMPRPKPNVHFAWGDADKLLFPKNESAFDATGRQVMSKVLFNKYGFDAAAVMFAVHYFFESELTLRTFLQNITDTLKIGGIFFGSTFDGAKVFQLLKENRGKVSKFYNGNPFFTIEKAYTDRTFNPEKPNLGRKIYVKIESIGLTHPEYLVNFDYFIKMAKEYGLEPVEIKNFGTYYNELEESNDPQCDKFSGMSEEEKLFSFLNNMFVFRKIQNASDSVFQRLMDLRKKEGKKEVKEDIKEIEIDEALSQGYSADIVSEEVKDKTEDEEYDEKVEDYDETKQLDDETDIADEIIEERQDSSFQTELDETFDDSIKEDKTLEKSMTENSDLSSASESKSVKMRVIRKKDKKQTGGIGILDSNENSQVSISKTNVKKSRKPTSSKINGNIKTVFIDVPDEKSLMTQAGGVVVGNPTADQSRPYLASYGHFQVEEISTPVKSSDSNVKTIIIS